MRSDLIFLAVMARKEKDVVLDVHKVMPVMKLKCIAVIVVPAVAHVQTNR